MRHVRTPLSLCGCTSKAFLSVQQRALQYVVVRGVCCGNFASPHTQNLFEGKGMLPFSMLVFEESAAREDLLED